VATRIDADRADGRAPRVVSAILSSALLGALELLSLQSADRTRMNPPDPLGPRALDLEGKLRERIKELDFLHHAARLLNMRGEPRDILAAVLQLLPDAWQYPELATARIVFGDLELETRGHQSTPWCMRAELEVALDRPRQGLIEVCYARAPSDPGQPFLPEERALLASCAELIKSYFERIGAETIASKLAEAQAGERAERAINRAKDEFFSYVAHELRASLHVMRGWIQILRQGPKDSDTAGRGLAILERNILLQAKLVDDLLDLSRIVSGKLQLEQHWLDLAELVAYAVDATRPAAQAKSLELKCELEPVGTVLADQQRLQQVVYNVLGNAVKFTPDGGTIEVALRKVGSHAELRVTDSGPGIEPELLPHVFERFRQGRVGRKGHGGLGLGLAIAHHIVERHHGTITASSEGPGTGATFRVLLPLGSPLGPAPSEG
jgi:signal transduction histidine kinase